MRIKGTHNDIFTTAKLLYMNICVHDYVKHMLKSLQSMMMMMMILSIQYNPYQISTHNNTQSSIHLS